MTEPAPEYDDYEDWRDLMDMLEERDREYWAGDVTDTDD